MFFKLSLFGYVILPRWRAVTIVPGGFCGQRSVDRIGMGVKIFLPVQRTDFVNGRLAVDHGLRDWLSALRRQLRLGLISVLGLFSGSFLQGGIVLQFL